MTWQEYVQSAERTANRGPEDTFERRMTMCALGLVGEGGETPDEMKKALFHGHAFDRGAMLKELGDVLWYVAIAASTAGIDLSQLWNAPPQQDAVDEAFVAKAAVNPALVLAFNAADAALALVGFKDYTSLPEGVRAEIANKLHPVLLMVGLLAKMLGSSLEAVAEANIAKLRERYPDGFETERSIHRVV